MSQRTILDMSDDEDIGRYSLSHNRQHTPLVDIEPARNDESQHKLIDLQRQLEGFVQAQVQCLPSALMIIIYLTIIVVIWSTLWTVQKTSWS